MKYDVDRIKQVVSCRELCENNGIEVTRKGKAVCLFHADKNPSMMIYKDGYHCFACGAHGDTIDLARKIYECDFSTACKVLSENYGIMPMQDGTYRDREAEARKRRTEREQRIELLRQEYFSLVGEMRRLEQNRRDYAPRSPTDLQHPLFVEALTRYDIVCDAVQNAEWRLHDAEMR